MTYTKEYKESIQKYINSLAEKEKKEMDARVTKFLTTIMNGTDAETAIKDSGIEEMELRDVLTEIAGVWNNNTLEALLNYQKWTNSSMKIMNALQTLKDKCNSVKELDNALSMIEKVTEETVRQMEK